MTRSGLILSVLLSWGGGQARADALTDAAALGDAMVAAADAVADARAIYMSGDQVAALAVLIPAADGGNMRAQNIVGASYQHGNGVAADAGLALHYLSLAAAQLYPPALHNLGYLYEVGMPGLAPDPVAARAWYARASALDFAPSMGNLGSLMLRGIGGPVDLNGAIRNLERGVGLDDSNAAEWLGYAYATGQGVAVDLVQARHSYEIAAVTGSGPAATEYAGMLERGEGGPVDLPDAMRFYQRGIAADDADAGIGAAWLVFENADIFPDHAEGVSYCLWALAQAAESDRALWQDSCDEAAALLDPLELRVAQKRADRL